MTPAYFVAPPGIGKTVLGTYLIARRARSTLVLVHRKPLLDQWVAQLAMFLGIDEKAVGQIGGGKCKPNSRVDVAMIQSLVRKGQVKDLVAGYGHVIVDECHHLPAISFERVLSEVKARYLVGLTATPQRRDGHHPITEMQLGPIRFFVDARVRPHGVRLLIGSSFARRPFKRQLAIMPKPASRTFTARSPTTRRGTSASSMTSSRQSTRVDRRSCSPSGKIIWNTSPSIFARSCGTWSCCRAE
jgi:hypothetical protein